MKSKFPCKIAYFASFFSLSSPITRSYHLPIAARVDEETQHNSATMRGRGLYFILNYGDYSSLDYAAIT